MKRKMRKKAVSLLLSLLLFLNVIPVNVFAATEGSFVLVAESGGELVIAPEYITYTEGQTVWEALTASGHEFTVQESGFINVIDGVGGNYTRYDEDGDFDLGKSAAEVEYFRFSESNENDKGTISEGLQLLMKAMADYQTKEADVKAAAKAAYDTAYEQFVGIDSDSAKLFADELNTAIGAYEESQGSTKYSVTFSDGNDAYTNIAYSGVSITMENAYGKTWTDDEDGVLEVPAGEYAFSIRYDGLCVEGNITVSGEMTVEAPFPEDTWLKLDAFRLSGSYGAEDNEDNKFTDDEFTVGEWDNRQTTVLVTDTFTGKVYTYAEYDESQLDDTTKLSAIYQSAKTEEEMEEEIPFESLTSGAANVLKKGASGNTVIYRVSTTKEDGYTYSQDYTVVFERIPTLASISVTDQDGTDQIATTVFDGNENNYQYKVLNTVTKVTVTAKPMDDSYDVTINGENAKDGVTVTLGDSEETTIEVEVSANGYTNTYTLTVCPGEGVLINFSTSSAEVTLEVVNGNGEVLPFTTERLGDSGNRYKYTLIPGETYSYVATSNGYYHSADSVTTEDAANSTITVDVPTEDWLSELAFGSNKSSSKKGSLPLNQTFDAAEHSYSVSYVDTEHNAYTWITTDSSVTDITVQAIYNQVFASSLYHGKEKTIDLTSGASSGTQLNRFLMDENPICNTVTIRLTKESDGITYYQDYEVEFIRTLTLKDISASCDGITTVLKQEDETTGFNSDVKEYFVTVSMLAEKLDLSITRYTDTTCYGEENVGYRVKLDGEDVTDNEVAEVALDGTINTQDVTITVENDKSPLGTTEYVLHILKSPPVEAAFTITPTDALLTFYETMSSQRLWADENGNYQFCEGYSYKYFLTEYGYVSKYGTLEVTRDEDNNLVVTNGSETYKVTESETGGGEVAITWTLQKAETNSAINVNLTAEWADFRGSETNNGVTDSKIPTAAEGGTLYWANQIGSGFDADAVGSPIIVDGDIITYASDKIYRIDTVTGEILATGSMDHKSSFSITPPVYANGMVFVALSNGTVQAFNAVTLESLWIYADPLGGQPNCPLTVKNGYLYTGFWNSETGDANFICLSITDEDITQTKENKCASWYYTQQGGYYWAGAYVSDDYVMVGTDDGTNSGKSQTSRVLLLEPKTGMLLDSWEGLNGDIRSSIVYDSETNAHYFTSKGGSLYSVKVKETEEGWELTDGWSVALENGTGGTPMSTSSPVVYNGRAYVGVSGSAQFGAYSGHNITVIDLNKKSIAYRAETQGYPQTSGLLTTAYEEESGYVYIYFFDNMTPGKLRVLRDKAGQTSVDYVTVEGNYTTAYALFTPTGDQAQYAICSPIVDEYGTIYFKNDSAYLMAFGSAIEKIEVTTLPNKMYYEEGETFDPEGMVVTATYANGKTRDITKYVTYSSETVTSDNTLLTISFEYVMYHNEEDGTSMTTGIPSSTPVTTLQLNIGSEPEITYGDVNGDGKVDIRDVNLITSYVNKKITFTKDQMTCADVNGDSKVTIDDAKLVRNYYNEVIDQFPVGN